MLIRHPDRRALEHAGVQVHDLFDLGGMHVEAADQDHVLLAIDDAGESLRIHHADVPGLEESIRSDRLRGFFGTIPIASHDLRPSDADLAALADWQVHAVVVADCDLGVGHRQADRSIELGQVEAIHRRHRRGLGKPIALDDRAAGNARPFLRSGLLHRHAAAIRDHQLAEIEFGECGIVGQRIEQGIDRGEHVHAVIAQRRDEPRNVAGIRNQQIHDPHPRAQHVAGREREDVIQRQRADDGQGLVAELVQHRREPGLALQDVGDDVPVQQGRAL